ncbi:MAG: hypothetical protein Q9211_004430 [Gyalolechia sp. 1 TL-2023]
MTDAMTTATSPYAKCFIPLESDPSVLNDLMYDLGVSKSLALVDVVSIEDPALLGVIPRPALALILVLPTSDGYERHRRSTKKMVEGAGDLKTEAIIWLRQTIDNACGLYAILHAICNFESTGYIPGNREALLNDSVDLETMYTKAAVRGSTLPPPAEDEVDLHYICFLRSPNGSIYEMDGDAIGPVKTDLSLKHNEDLLDASALECVKRCIARGDADMNFSLLALVANLGDSD